MRVWLHTQGERVRSRPGPIWSWKDFYGHSPTFCWSFNLGLLSVISDSKCTKYRFTTCSNSPRKKVWVYVNWPSRHDHSCLLGRKSAHPPPPKKVNFYRVQTTPVTPRRPPCSYGSRGGGGVSWGLFWYGCASQFFETCPNHIPRLRKKWPINILDLTKCLHIHILFFDFIYTLFAVCKQSLQINITIWFLSWISEQKYEYFQTGMSENGTIHITMMKNWVTENGTIHITMMKNWVSHIPFFRKRGLNVYLAALKRGLFGTHIPTTSYTRDMASSPELL